MEYKTLNEMGDIKGKRVLLRLDFNVAQKDGKILDRYRIDKSIPTIEEIRCRGAKVIILAHIENAEEPTLKYVYEYLQDKMPIVFATEQLGAGLEEKAAALRNGEVLLLENIRMYEGEKKNDKEFVKQLAALGDFYVNDAFSVSHRAHATVVGIPSVLPGFAGPLFDEEVRNLCRSLDPEKPFLFILGGAKFDTKMPLVTKFLNIADKIFIGGALANDCYKSLGLPIGQSVVSQAVAEGTIDLTPIVANKKVILPTQVVVKNGEQISIKNPTDVLDDDSILDAGGTAIEDLQSLVSSSNFILWNGPLGNYELGFKDGTIQLAKMIAESDADSVVGGGDTITAIEEANISDKFSYLSAAGGAMLDYLANETLPGIQALEKSK